MLKHLSGLPKAVMAKLALKLQEQTTSATANISRTLFLKLLYLLYIFYSNILY